MAWYKTGTLSIAANSKKATGHGTRWADNKQGIGAGQMLLLPGTGSVALYEIASVVSETELLLVSGPPKAVKEASYAIVNYNGGSYVDFGRELSAQLRYYQRQMDGWQHIMTGEGEVTLDAPDGTQVTLSSFKKLMADVAGKMDKTALDGKADKSELENKADKSALDGKLDKTGGTVNGVVIVEGNQLVLKGDDRKHLGFHNQGGRTATFHENGDVAGPIWGGALSGWLNNTFSKKSMIMVP